ncbi:MAG: HD domain-containing protein [Erysipelotrichia bacterium]|nr:HD domain-containing protein [Erysipelotrichia bacterium]
MKLTNKETAFFLSVANEVLNSLPFYQTKQYLQHGRISTYDHCVSVAFYSYWLAKRMRLRCNDKSLIRGALLHDLYLYDWHIKDDTHKWHGFHHAKKARINALRYYQINPLEERIILSHMWPLTFRCFPNRKEAFIVCLIDKLISTCETLHINCRVNHKIKE